MFWLIAAGIGVFAAGFLYLAARLGGGRVAAPGAHDLQVYRDQLTEIERDRDRGLISETAAEAAELEVKRRMLAVADRAEEEADAATENEPGESVRRLPGSVIAVAVLAVPIAGVAGYLLVGRPDLATGPVAVARGPTQEDIRRAASMTPEQRRQMIRGMVEGLEARLREKPDDFAGWMRLGRVRAVLGEWAKSAAAYARARSLKPDSVPALESFITARLRTVPRNQPLPEDLREAVGQLALKQPNHPLALYLGGVAAAEAGRNDLAIRLWRQLLTRLPAGSPLAPVLRKRIAALEKPKPAPGQNSD